MGTGWYREAVSSAVLQWEGMAVAAATLQRGLWCLLRLQNAAQAPHAAAVLFVYHIFFVNLLASFYQPESRCRRLLAMPILCQEMGWQNLSNSSTVNHCQPPIGISPLFLGNVNHLSQASIFCLTFIQVRHDGSGRRTSELGILHGRRDEEEKAEKRCGSIAETSVGLTYRYPGRRMDQYDILLHGVPRFLRWSRVPELNLKASISAIPNWKTNVTIVSETETQLFWNLSPTLLVQVLQNVQCQQPGGSFWTTSKDILLFFCCFMGCLWCLWCLWCWTNWYTQIKLCLGNVGRVKMFINNYTIIMIKHGWFSSYFVHLPWSPEAMDWYSQRLRSRTG